MTNNTGRFLTSSDRGARRSASPFASSGGHRRAAPRSLRIIVADDDRDQVLTLMTILGDEGHEVRGADNGPRTLRLMHDFDPDVVLLDIGLPEMSGYEVARRIRKTDRGARPLLIAISGQYKQGSDKILAQVTGFDHYLVKPFAPAALIALIAPLASP